LHYEETKLLPMHHSLAYSIKLERASINSALNWIIASRWILFQAWWKDILLLCNTRTG